MRSQLQLRGNISLALGLNMEIGPEYQRYEAMFVKLDDLVELLVACFC